MSSSFLLCMYLVITSLCCSCLTSYSCTLVCRKYCNDLTVMFLSFRTDRSGQTVQTRSDCSYRSSLIRVYTVCHFVCIFWTRYSMVEHLCLIFRVIAVNFPGVQISRNFTVALEANVSCCIVLIRHKIKILVSPGLQISCFLG